MEFTASDLWARVLEAARPGIAEQSYRTWLAPSRGVAVTADELIVETASRFHAEWLEDKYGGVLQEVVARISGHSLHLRFRAAELPDAPAVTPEVPLVEVTSPTPPRSAFSPPNPEGVTPVPRRERSGAALNERYTFERFVVGNNNQLAAAASVAVAEQPARIYNPLFLYGGVGLGKTHLMHAVAHAILAHRPSTRVSYVSTEQFMNELVTSIKTGTTPEFRRRFRQVDLLLVDDVQFLAGKDSTQEEFFHTFNALHDAGRQIIVTSDRPPKELEKVEDRLVSRFEWGLVADIKPPDYETRVAILRKKAEDDDLILDDEVIQFIAHACTSSVRELEGAVIKLLALSSLRRTEITLELAHHALEGTVRTLPGVDRSNLNPSTIRTLVARRWHVAPEALASKKRTRELTVPRQVAMYLIKELLNESLIRIGQEFGGRDHSTVIHSLRKVEEEMEDDPSFARQVEEARESILRGERS